MLRRAPFALFLLLLAAAPAGATKRPDAVVPACPRALSPATKERMATHTPEEITQGLRDFLGRDPIFQQIIKEARRSDIQVWVTGRSALRLRRLAQEQMAQQELGVLPLEGPDSAAQGSFFSNPEETTELLVAPGAGHIQHIDIANFLSDSLYHWLENEIPLVVGSRSPWSVKPVLDAPADAVELHLR